MTAFGDSLATAAQVSNYATGLFLIRVHLHQLIQEISPLQQ
jgi:hypothetical protein